MKKLRSNHIFFNKAINGIINNVKHNFYGNNPFDITGPQFLYKYRYFLSKNIIILEFNNSGNYITYNNKIIILRLKKYLKIKADREKDNEKYNRNKSVTFRCHR